MKTSARGVALIKAYEGLRLKAYLCAAGVWTIGYGHTSDNYFKVRKNTTITKAKADDLLRHDIEEAETFFESVCKTRLNANQYGAVISLMFNIGNGAFKRSQVLKKLNRGDLKGAARAFNNFTRVGNQRRHPGLVRRRAAEIALFNTPATLADKALVYPEIDGASKETEEMRDAKGAVRSEKSWFSGFKETVLAAGGGYTAFDYFDLWERAKSLVGDNLGTIAIAGGILVAGWLIWKNWSER